MKKGYKALLEEANALIETVPLDQALRLQLPDAEPATLRAAVAGLPV